MPRGKPAGARCVQLTDDNRCRLFGAPQRPRVCRDFRPMPDVCGASREQALARLVWLESVTTR
jgi:hypothetical protein